MKKITKQALLLLLAMPFWACSTDDLETVERIQGGDFVLTTQQQVNAFTSSADIASLTITGSDIADLSAFAREKGVTYADLKRFNPWLRARKLQTAGKTYTLQIPQLSEMDYRTPNTYVHDPAWVVK